MKLWEKNFEIASEIERFTVGRDRELDLLLAPYDVLGTLAHIQMLSEIDLLPKQDLPSLQIALISLYQQIEKGQFEIEEGVEDVHSQVELILTRQLGDLGKKIHSGRSRNDQVLLDLKLFIRAGLEQTLRQVYPLFEQLLELSDRYAKVLLPGYTHYQVAMPSSFGLWFGAYAESLLDDVILLRSAFALANKNPLGSAAGYGSSFPLKRQRTTELLGFDVLNYNVVYAQMGRGKTEKIVAQALGSVAATLAKMAQDLCLYLSQNFSFLSFPDHLTTGSSIMPHKKNPDVFELVRAKCNKIQALPNEIALITTNLASGYHRDLQIIKESFLPVFEELNDCLGITHYMLKHIEVKDNLMQDEKYRYAFSVEEVNKRVLAGVPFRQAYQEVGELIAQGQFQPDYHLEHSHEGSIGNLCNQALRDQMDELLRDFPLGNIHQAITSLLVPPPPA